MDNTILTVPQKPGKSIYTRTKIVNDKLTDDFDLKCLRNRFEQFEIFFKDANNLNPEKSLDLYIFELSSLYEYLEKEYLNLEANFVHHCSNASEIKEKLNTKLRLISINSLELEAKLRFLNEKLPELEDMTMKHENLIHALSYRYNDANYDTIKDLQKNVISINQSNCNMENDISNIKHENGNLSKEMQRIIDNSLNMKNVLNSKRDKIQENLKYLEKENCELRSKIDSTQHENSQSLALKQKIKNLEIEIAALMNQIKISKSDIVKLVDENSSLKSVIKKLVFKQVLTEF